MAMTSVFYPCEKCRVRSSWCAVKVIKDDLTYLFFCNHHLDKAALEDDGFEVSPVAEEEAKPVKKAVAPHTTLARRQPLEKTKDALLYIQQEIVASILSMNSTDIEGSAKTIEVDVTQWSVQTHRNRIFGQQDPDDDDDYAGVEIKIRAYYRDKMWGRHEDQ